MNSSTYASSAPPSFLPPVQSVTGSLNYQSSKSVEVVLDDMELPPSFSSSGPREKDDDDADSGVAKKPDDDFDEDDDEDEYDDYYGGGQVNIFENYVKEESVITSRLRGGRKTPGMDGSYGRRRRNLPGGELAPTRPKLRASSGLGHSGSAYYPSVPTTQQQRRPSLSLPNFRKTSVSSRSSSSMNGEKEGSSDHGSCESSIYSLPNMAEYPVGASTGSVSGFLPAGGRPSVQKRQSGWGMSFRRLVGGSAMSRSTSSRDFYSYGGNNSVSGNSSVASATTLGLESALERIAKSQSGSVFDDAAALVAAGHYGGRAQYRFATNDRVLVSLEISNQSAYSELFGIDDDDPDPEKGEADNVFDNNIAGNTNSSINSTAMGGSIRQRKRRSRGPFNAGDKANETQADREARYEAMRERTTVVPVNKFGYPPGRGHRVEEQRGPYLYVLARVVMVHFEEDARYYTVCREDTGMEQRADAEWMSNQPLTDERGIKAAEAAARQTQAVLDARHFKGRSAQGKLSSILGSNAEDDQSQPQISALRRWTWHFIGNPYQKSRAWAFSQATDLMMGLSPYKLEFHFTAVNLLVTCSFLFLTLDYIRLAFAPPSYDTSLVQLSAVVWIILVAELCLEVFIRPAGYHRKLSRGPKKYSPTTARTLNNIHLIAESLALILYMPELQCLVSANLKCGVAGPFTLLRASTNKIFGPTRFHVSMGILLFLTTRLRIFGLVRHWKQSWFNRTVVEIQQEALNSPLPNSRSIQGSSIPSVLGTSYKSSHRESSIEREPTRRHENLSSSFTGMMNLNQTNHNDNRSSFVSTATSTTDFFGGSTENSQYFKRGRRHPFRRSIANGRSISEALKEIRTRKRDDDSIELRDHSLYAQNFKQRRQSTSQIESGYSIDTTSMSENPRHTDLDEDLQLNNVANIGTALMMVNSHRSMILLISMVAILSFLNLINETNLIYYNSVVDLQSINLSAPGYSDDDCLKLQNGVRAWVLTVTQFLPTVAWARLLPVRCDFQREDGTIPLHTPQNLQWIDTFVNSSSTSFSVDASQEAVARMMNVSIGKILTVHHAEENVLGNGVTYDVKIMADVADEIFVTNVESLMLQLLLLIVILGLLHLLRKDAVRFVLEPLRRMLKIVLHYAKNPLAPPPNSGRKLKDEGKIGDYETEQLITAVTKITDLLRKCWGVAGAGIISSNLARTKESKMVMVNPCVPGKLVYALFGFAGINDFSSHLSVLDHNIIDLINDIAKVLHDEVFRWGFGKSGQCNKNLGASFLMVFRIGDFKEVENKRNIATNVIFDTEDNSLRSRNNSIGRRRNKKKDSHHSHHHHHTTSKTHNDKEILNTVQLATLPGISLFADRAVVGMLKTYAGIHRDRNVCKWNKDFRLGAGVGAVTIDMSFGMDAGWAVEGAVGSIHKIDATYLSPHVNMASRMMSANEQYGVTMLISQAAHELLSNQAKARFRHIDTVTVKGSSVQQRIYTYDAKFTFVDFFLFAKSDALADIESDQFSSKSWDEDRDLLAMRQHVTEDFEREFNKGRNLYLAGQWPMAIRFLRNANRTMIRTMIEEGNAEHEVKYLEKKLLSSHREDQEQDEEISRLRTQLGDGPCQCLIQYMESRNRIPPSDWAGYRPLVNK